MELDQLPPEAPRVMLATGKLVGEGFDHPSLDTLVLAMPISWKGTLQQYAGRLHREACRARPTYGSSTSSIPATRHCCGCGTSVSEAIARWGIGWQLDTRLAVWLLDKFRSGTRRLY